MCVLQALWRGRPKHVGVSRFEPDSSKRRNCVTSPCAGRHGCARVEAARAVMEGERDTARTERDKAKKLAAELIKGKASEAAKLQTQQQERAQLQARLAD